MASLQDKLAVITAKGEVWARDISSNGTTIGAGTNCSRQIDFGFQPIYLA